MSTVVSWSEGKEICLALYRALRNGVKVSHLLTIKIKGLCKEAD
jgi:diphthamide synthase (EF-2-diphthine--ammonia ligase)